MIGVAGVLAAIKLLWWQLSLGINFVKSMMELVLEILDRSLIKQNLLLPTSPSSEQLHSQGFVQVPGHPGYFWHWSQFSPDHPGAQMHVFGIVQNPFLISQPFQ